ncbi:shikimate dehydrogenase [Serratia sp. DD3]|nr:shikimate dehydrogenase [Serratia sp. DD3]
MLPLLAFGGQIVLTNRTFSRVQEMMKAFQHLGAVSALPMDQLAQQHVDLVINATASEVNDEITALLESMGKST